MNEFLALCFPFVFGSGFENSPVLPPGPIYEEVVKVAQTADARTYEDIWDAWGRNSGTRHISVSNDHYAALPFTIGPAPDDDFAILIWDQIFRSPTQVRISVSECAGAPKVETAVSEGCYFQGNAVSGSFAMKLSGLPVGCFLKPNVPYFFVFSFIDAEGKSGCDRSRCYWNISEN